MTAGGDLLWINYSEQEPTKRHDVAAAARQHVMLNYIAKHQPGYSAKNRGPDGRRLSNEDGEDQDDGESRMRRQRRAILHKPSGAFELKGKGSKVKRTVPLSDSTKIPLVSTINPALVLHEDCEIYQAAWWHSLNICQTDQSKGWIDVCRSQWGQGFWDFAKEDGTLREIFLSYAAAKEAAVKSLTDSKAYFVHKGRAMRLVAKDLQMEGKDLRIAALAAICLLAKATFIEEEYEAGEAHVAAIKAVVEGRVQELPNFLWLFVIWADLRLTGVTHRAPLLPYFLHQDFHEAELPAEMQERAGFLGSCNLISLPEEDAVPSERMAVLFQNLHLLAFVYNAPDDTDWPPVWVVTYDAAWMLADMKHLVKTQHDAQKQIEAPYNPEWILLLAIGIQFWSNVSQFVPQPGFIRYGLTEITEELSHLDPQTLSSHWQSRSGKPDSLLWILFNASAAAIKLCFIGYISASSLPHWLWLDLKHVCSLLDLTTSDAFEKALRPFPFADNWNGRMAKTVWLWLKTGFVLPSRQEKRERRAFFSNLRLTFDVEIDERMKQEDKNIVGKAYEMVLVGDHRTRTMEVAG